MKSRIFPSKLKLGDRVQVICGKEKGKLGNIAFFNRKKGLLSLDSIPAKKIQQKASQIAQEKGENGKEKELPVFIHLSNVMLWDEKANQAGRIGSKIENAQKLRFFKKSGNLLKTPEKMQKPNPKNENS